MGRYLDDKKRKNTLKKQGKWEEAKRREQVDEGEGMGEEEGAAGKNRGVGSGFGGTGGRGSGGRGSVRAKGQGHNVGQDVGFGLGRADDEEGASFAGAETIRCVAEDSCCAVRWQVVCYGAVFQLRVRGYTAPSALKEASDNEVRFPMGADCTLGSSRKMYKMLCDLTLKLSEWVACRS